MEKVNTELKKQEHFRKLMYSFNWLDYLEEQLANNFSDEEAVHYITYIIEHLTPQFKQSFLKNIYNDTSVRDEVLPEDYVNGNNLADINAHLRFYNQIEKELDNLIPLLIKKKEEKRLDVKLSEKAERNKKTKKKYGYTGLKLLVENNFNEVTDEFHKILKEYKLISDLTSLADFRRIFRGVDTDILLDNRVVWLKSVPALKAFILMLDKKQLIQELPEQGKWDIIANCFRNSKYEAYNNRSFKNNNDLVLKDVEDAISEVVDYLKTLVI